MIGIPQNDLGIDIIFKFALVDTFNRSGCPHRHKNGRLDDSVGRFDFSCAGFSIRVGVM
jgi:hypothetical protein